MFFSRPVRIFMYHTISLGFILMLLSIRTPKVQIIRSILDNNSFLNQPQDEEAL